ncbi:transporter substrate-binding domain-containing protein [Mesorhizobium sp. L-8-3]|uniref:transporter substrate-binding domain-containing protein n=1 Tax=Mesorhizobium sp. L-8-3 TaxID=2744522 RepID=UPI00192863A8|nr:transporter substrate-binding domain-containing protein [Mesorhizobium sp. L-8-3]BCH27274.1 amino acid ABC transporter [Mesorhizobium sp. L-8-3]
MTSIRNTAKALALLLSLTAPAAVAAHAAEPAIPLFWDIKERLPKPDLTKLPRLRFLTTIDFPPFNHLDGSGRLSGFHVDLARAICAELEIMPKCQIQALPWGELDKAMQEKQGEAIIAGLAVTAENRARYDFSRPYLKFPARFVTPRAKSLTEPLFDKLPGQRIGVMAGSAHERMLRSYFPDTKAVTYSRQDWMLQDLKDGKLAGVFGDGMRLAFWLAGTDSAGCCRFSGGPYLSTEYLGNGLAVATEHGNAELAAALDYALQQIATKGTFAELYLRYFPVSFY